MLFIKKYLDKLSKNISAHDLHALMSGAIFGPAHEADVLAENNGPVCERRF